MIGVKFTPNGDKMRPLYKERIQFKLGNKLLANSFANRLPEYFGVCQYAFCKKTKSGFDRVNKKTYPIKVILARQLKRQILLILLISRRLAQSRQSR